MDSQITTIARQAIADRLFPGCVVGYVRDGRRAILPFGRFTYEADSPAVVADSAWDVASITKSIPVHCLVLHLVNQGKLGLDDQLIAYIPELTMAGRERILIHHLLTYTVILKLDRGMSELAREMPDEMMKILTSLPLKADPGSESLYTNTPAIWLGMVIERITGKPLDVISDETFFEPLGMSRTTFRGERFSKEEVVPTTEDFRGRVQGIPNDETAWALRRQHMIAGNAGLFSTVGDLQIFMDMLLDRGTTSSHRYFSPELIKAMYTNQVPNLPTSMGLGWETEWARCPEWPGGDQMFGKTGFTGCAIVANPVTKDSLIYLSNRTYPQRPTSREGIQAFRNNLMKVVFSR